MQSSSWLCCALILLFPSSCESSKCEKNSDCINGVCKANICICNNYWWGDLCQFCRERRSEDEENKMYIVEGKQNSLPSKCAWLIEAKDTPENRSVKLNINEFSGSCGKRSLYIYDGSSIQSPLIAVISGLISTGSVTNAKPLHLQVESGSAFIVLTGNDKSQTSPGCRFNITYSFEQRCSAECSSHGYCEQQDQCVCDKGWTSSNCSQPTCPVPCINGSCVREKRWCNCASGFRGQSCDISDGRESWNSPVANDQDLLHGVASHATVVHRDDIWLFGGLSLAKGPLDTLARYSITDNRWELVQSSNATQPDIKPPARYGHSIVEFKNSLFLFGGTSQGDVHDDVWSFNVTASQWTLLTAPHSTPHGTKPVGVTGHTATVVDRTMIVLFGYTFKEGFSRKIQVFDLVAHEWTSITEAPASVSPTYGHSSVYDPVTERIYVHGGYRRTPGEPCTEVCSDLLSYDPGTKAWQSGTLPSSGSPRFLHTAVLFGNKMLVYGGREQDTLPSHPLAVYNIADKKWRTLNQATAPESVSRYGHTSVLHNSTMYVFGGFGGKMFNSFLQYSPGDCFSPKSPMSCRVKPLSPPSTSHDTCVTNMSSLALCHTNTDCAQCLKPHSDCLWCESQKLCVPKVAYNVIFPYLQCSQVLEQGQGTCASDQCSGVKSCQECHTLPGCGWCDDILATGLGKCMGGGNDAPFAMTCAKPQWYFVECPACQCHGHSKCSKENICGECKDHTTGSNCDHCEAGFYGDPRNGGKCHECQCSHHAETCAVDTGECTCLTVGVSGRRCNKCNESDGYYGEAFDYDFCYYSFSMMATASFNLTGKRRFSFAYYPNMDKRNVKLEVRWAKHTLGANAVLNITSFYAMKPDEPEVMLDEKESVGNFEQVYRYQDYPFASADKFGFRGYVYDVSCEKICSLKIVVTQPTDNIDLLKFFLTFFGCFLSLLVVAGIVWKVRNRYISFILSRQRREERHKMASRPFAKVSVLIHSPCKSTPAPVSVEPCASSKASVLTVLMRLPGDESGFTPIDQSGMCFASVLGTHGDPVGNNGAGKATRIRTRKRCSATCV